MAGIRVKSFMELKLYSARMTAPFPANPRLKVPNAGNADTEAFWSNDTLGFKLETLLRNAFSATLRHNQKHLA